MSKEDKLNLAADLRRLSYWWLEDNRPMIDIFWPKAKIKLSMIKDEKQNKLANELINEMGGRERMAERLMTLSLIQSLS